LNLQQPNSRFLESLSQAEALKRLQLYGPNLITQDQPPSVWNRIKKILREPMLFLLLAVAAIYLLIGSHAEGLLIGLSILVVIGISYMQQRKSDTALALLRNLSSPLAIVFRDGVEKRIPSSDVVPGDLILIGEGDRISADGSVIEASNLSVDESLLTGESFPLNKQPSQSVFSSTLVTKGHGFIRVLNTGEKTQVGTIGKSLNLEPSSDFSLSKEINQTVRLFAVAGLVICLVIVVTLGVQKSDWLSAFLSGLAAAIALLPEEFPVIVSIFMAMGAWRLAKTGVLARNAQAIERLGAITDLCVDKTGTITQNKMSVAAIATCAKTYQALDLTGSNSVADAIEVVRFGALASPLISPDPMETALHVSLKTIAKNLADDQNNLKLIKEYPLSEQLLATTYVWQPRDESKHYALATKGAPEAVMNLCHLNELEKGEIKIKLEEFSKNALRVLGVAEASTTGALPKNQSEFNFRWIGLIGFEDPIRDEVPEAIRQCHAAGINVIMMTGDYPSTAARVASLAGMRKTEVTTGQEIDGLSDDELGERIRSSSVFARLQPSQKLRLVHRLQSSGRVVGMTGDGVNDAPALKAADVGIAMGLRGTDVAREASDLILTDDSFSSIVGGIKRGREIFSNIRSAMTFVGSIHVPIAGLAVIPILFGLPIILLPVHIVFLELLIDPSCSLLFESRKPTKDVMTELPRPLETKIFSKSDIVRSLSQGALILAASLALIWYFYQNLSAEKLRAIIFLQVVLGNIGLIIADFTGGSPREMARVLFRSNNLKVLIGTLGLVAALFLYEPLRRLFQMDHLSMIQMTIAAAAALMTATLQGIWNWKFSSAHALTKPGTETSPKRLSRSHL
jgi:Ca2+-transporting ATPase